LNRGIQLGADDFELLKVLGRGGFGIVYLARKTDNNELVALKVMKKSKIAARNKAQEIKNERDVMAQNEQSIWLVKMLYSFQNSLDLFIAMVGGN
jgi:p70 ribosomal S6 kinase